MKQRRKKLIHPADRGPLRVMFVITSMPVGGMETLLVNLIRRMDRVHFEPELCCLKEFGPLGEQLTDEVPAFTGLLANKYDIGVWGRLTELLKRRRIDAVVTVGTGGDKMFWGRLAAWRAGVPVILSALHSTGLPDRVERLNRLLAPITDGFIGVAEPHARYLAACEGCPENRVFVIPNGVNVERFKPIPPSSELRARLGLPEGAPVATIVAALRPEKNHELFLRAAAKVHAARPDAHFLVIGDGALKPQLEKLTAELRLGDSVHYLGTRSDIPELLALTDVFALSSHMEANPVSILEALACGKPVVATHVGSVPEVVIDRTTGYLVSPGDVHAMSERILELFGDRELAQRMGAAGRDLVVNQWSLERMVRGYEELITELYTKKCPTPPGAATKPAHAATSV
jgi:glycosyltransferase involved in cell wall biosynthesis